MVYPDQEEVHKVLPLFLPSGDSGGRAGGVMKLNPPPASWEALSAGGRHTDGAEKAVSRVPPVTPTPASPIPPGPEQATVPEAGTMPEEVSFGDSLGQSPSHCLIVALYQVGSREFTSRQAPPIARLPRLPVTPCTPTVLLFYRHCDQTPNNPNSSKEVPRQSPVAGGS